MSEAAAAPATRIRDLGREDLDRVVRIDEARTGEAKPEYWEGIFHDFVPESRRPGRVGLAAVAGAEVVGYLVGEVRAFEFGSEPCGWVISVGVDPGRERAGVATALLREACRRFREAGVARVRTMVRRTDVPVLSFFRSHGFVGGSFTQLELDLEEGA